jgi:(S)-2-hydroxyglutarate dehydrogenase
VPNRPRFDVGIVGAGLVGLAVGRALQHKYPAISLVLLEKEDHVAVHQSAHNSGVVHSGLYYKPGSLKARLSVEGRQEIYEICERNDIPHRRSGKLVVATHPSELAALDELERRGRANGLHGIRRLPGGAIRDIEPGAEGVAALHVPEAGVADFPALARHLARALSDDGGRVLTGHPVTAIDHMVDGVKVTTPGEQFDVRVLVNCAGLHSDRVARLSGARPEVRIVPFRGEYYKLDDSAAHLVKELIYPVPDPRFPFLGVHFTRRVDGTVEVGPNAVLALGREHYRGAGPNWGDLREVLSYPGFLRLAMRHWRSGTGELLHSRSRRLYARLARRLIPAVRAEHLIPGGTGVRAQAVSRDGSLVDDFVIERTGLAVHVLNAPSPGATASLAIGRHIANDLEALLRR